MSTEIKKNYKIDGSGVLNIDNNIITIDIEDYGELNLSDILKDLNGRYIKFTFSYDENYVLGKNINK